jgi:septal ring factor EnvC (AmiA/AmiB activator)
MELVTEPGMYAPSMNDAGNYVDKIPPFSTVKHGLRCPCGSRKDKVYETVAVFASHVKTKHHQKWLAEVNTNKTNFLVENETLKTTIQNQRLIIAQMEKELQNQRMTIEYLTKQLISYEAKVDNLLDFD